MKQTSRLLLNHKKEARVVGKIYQSDFLDIIRYARGAETLSGVLAKLPLLDSILSARKKNPRNERLSSFLETIGHFSSNLVAFYFHPDNDEPGIIKSHTIVASKSDSSGNCHHIDLMNLPEPARDMDLRNKIGFFSAKYLVFEGYSNKDISFAPELNADFTIVPFEIAGPLEDGKQMLIFAQPPGFSEPIEMVILKPSALAEKDSNGWFGPVVCSSHPNGKIISAAGKRRDNFTILQVTDAFPDLADYSEASIFLSGFMEEIKEHYARMARDCREAQGDAHLVSATLQRISDVLKNNAIDLKTLLTFDTSAYE